MSNETEKRTSKPGPDVHEAPVAKEVAPDVSHQDESQSPNVPTDSRIADRLHALELRATAIRENQLTLDTQPRLGADFEKRMNALELQLTAINESQRALITAQHSTGLPGESIKAVPVDPCGCRKADPCGCRKAPACCIELFISGLQFLKNNDGNMEIIVAVKAGDTWGVLPGLTSYILLDQNVSAIIPFHAVIARMCIECGTCKELPLKVDVLEVVQKKGGGEGRPESGSAESSITVSCACPASKTFLSVPFAKSEGKNVRGVVGVEIGTRLYPDSCC